MSDYERVAAVIRYLDEHQAEQPSLEVLARQIGLSRFHLHRLFSAWAGVTPKDFLQCLTLERTKRSLHEGRSLLDAAFDAGLSGPGRLHDLYVSLESASPGEWQAGGAQWIIEAGFAASPFGECLIGVCPRGVCHWSFVESGDRGAAWSELASRWPGARLQRNHSRASETVARAFAAPEARRESNSSLRAFVTGSAFQVRVWRALLRIPRGQLSDYGSIAAELGNPGAARAVGSAVGQNPVAILIPCHRVIRHTGAIGEYRWGSLRKRALLGWEGATCAAQSLSLRPARMPV